MRYYVTFPALTLIAAILLAGAGYGAEASNEAAALGAWLDAAMLQPATEAAQPTPLGAHATLGHALPFSFVYDGKPSPQLLGQWKRSTGPLTTSGGKSRQDITYADPKTGLQVVCELTRYEDYPAVEWLLRLANRGKGDTPIIEKILPLDLEAGLPAGGKAVFHYNKGSDTAMDDFLPIDKTLGEKDGVTLPAGKTRSQSFLPYFNLELPGAGLCGGIGWTGQWAIDVKREGRQIHLTVGQQLTHLRLHPGESIRTPRVLLVAWQGPDRMRGHNLFRRLLVAHYLPRLDGQVVPIPICGQYPDPNLNDTTEKMDLDSIAKCAGRGVEAYWRDAGWYEGRWTSTGSWTCDHKLLPHGFKPVADAAHRSGMKFLLWFEPERATAGSQIAKEHPEWLLTARDAGWNYPFIEGGKFNLGDPKARAWMTDLLSQRFTEYGVDIYRQDNNTPPVMFWRANDPADRQGITEIRHVEGLYAMWDELHRRHPRLIIDNANWRGTGPDLEVTRRSSGSFSRSEFADCGRNPVANQVATAGLSLYVPLHSNGLWSLTPYFLRSVCTTGANGGLGWQKPVAGKANASLAGQAPVAPLSNAWLTWQEPIARQAVAEIKLLRRLCLGDYYPLTAIDTSETSWCAWQFHRPDLGEGVAVFFRRPKCPSSSLEVALRGLDASAKYEVDFRETYDIRQTRKMTGLDLSKLRVDLNTQAASLLVHYRRVKN